MKRTYVFLSIFIAVFILVILYLYTKHQSPSYTFRFDKISKGDLTVYVTATGTINAVTTVDVGTQVSGIIARLYADFNSIVKKGQIIAQIDSTFLVQSVKDAEANLDKTRAQYEDSKRNYEREKTLLEKGLDSQVNYDAALTTYETSKANLKSAEAALDRAKINLAYSTIYAPIDGVVINRAVNVGQTVAASFSSPTLFTIANDLKKMQVQTTVDETDIGRVSVGQEATFTVDAYPDEKFVGIVSQIRLAPQSIQNVVNYIVIIDVHNDQLKLMPGLTANVKILVASVRNVLKVSNMALRFQPPTDIIDTTDSETQKNMFTGRKNFTDSFQAQDNEQHENQNRQMRGNGRSVETIRDSIQSAHGGNLTEDEVRSEVHTLYAQRIKQIRKKNEESVPKAKIPRKSYSFGITSIYPEYQKNEYSPALQTGRGRVWIVNENGLLQSVFVRTGLNDGRNTEIISTNLKPDDKIVIGATSDNSSGATQTQNPFAGSGSQRPGGGFR